MGILKAKHYILNLGASLFQILCLSLTKMEKRFLYFRKRSVISFKTASKTLVNQHHLFGSYNKTTRSPIFWKLQRFGDGWAVRFSKIWKNVFVRAFFCKLVPVKTFVFMNPASELFSTVERSFLRFKRM